MGDHRDNLFFFIFIDKSILITYLSIDDAMNWYQLKNKLETSEKDGTTIREMKRGVSND